MTFMNVSTTEGPKYQVETHTLLSTDTHTHCTDIFTFIELNVL